MGCVDGGGGEQKTIKIELIRRQSKVVARSRLAAERPVGSATGLSLLLPGWGAPGVGWDGPGVPPPAPPPSRPPPCAPSPGTGRQPPAAEPRSAGARRRGVGGAAPGLRRLQAGTPGQAPRPPAPLASPPPSPPPLLMHPKCSPRAGAAPRGAPTGSDPRPPAPALSAPAPRGQPRRRGGAAAGIRTAWGVRRRPGLRGALHGRA